MPEEPKGKTSMFHRNTHTELPTVDHGEGVYLWDTEGKRYLDGCSGALVANVGHGSHRVAQALASQVSQVAFTHSSSFTNRPAEELARKVADVTPGDLDWVYFVSGGSEASDTAIKMARQYWLEKDVGSQKHLVVSRWQSFHGNTLGALSLSGHVQRRRKYTPLLVHFPHIEPCYCYRCPIAKTYPGCQVACADQLEHVILQHGSENVAAFMSEPIVGATAGALVPPPEYFRRIREVCDKYDVLWISDEVMTGFGRTGKWFALEHWDVIPDIMTVAKGMSGGYTPIGAVIASEKIYGAFHGGSGMFVHGHTFSANPASCAAALEVQNILMQDNLVWNSARQGQYLLSRLKDLAAKWDCIGDVRGLGLMVGIELVSDSSDKSPFPPGMHAAYTFAERAMQNGLVVYPGAGTIDGLHGDHILLGPPLVITAAEIDEMVKMIDRTFADLTEDWRSDPQDTLDRPQRKTG